MLTPKEQAFLDRLQQQPGFSTMMQRLELTPIPSEAYRQSLAVQARVDVLIQEFTNTLNLPVAARSTYTEPPGPRLFWSPEQMKEWITTTKATL
jgi:hypothetical protein